MSLPVLLSFLPLGCLLSPDLYAERLAALTDDDGDGFTDEEGDCDDGDPAVAPGADEVCDGQDDDCDGSIDEDPVDAAWYPDGDHDDFGATALVVAACQAPEGFVDAPGDCDDDDPDVHPGADERCNGDDDDCDKAVDEEPVVDAPTWYLDADGDGWGDSSRSVEACDGGEDYVAKDGDCDDLDLAVHPEADEICGNGIDDDCDEDAGECRWEGELTVDEAAAVFPGESEDDHLGSALTALGDIDGDGIGEWAVGAYGHDGALADAGRVYLFSADISGEVDVDDALATIDGTSAFGFAGWTLARVGDYDKDGLSELLIGANNHEGNGAVFLMAQPAHASGSVGDALMTLTTSMVGANLGSAVAHGGDPNGDGYAALLAGASSGWEDGAGAAYLVEGPTEGTVQTADANATFHGEAAGDGAGFAVASGDFDGDGLTDVAVGAPLSDRGVTDGGAVLIVLGVTEGTTDLSDSDWSVVGEHGGDYLGARLMSHGDLDGDGCDDLAGSAPYDDTIYNDAGAVFVIDGLADSMVALSAVDTLLRGARANQVLGASIDLGLDHNGDGLGDLVVGTGGGGGATGRLDIYYGPIEGVLDATEAASVTSDEPDDGTGFAVAMTEVSSGGDVRLLVGATDRNDGAGMVWITRTARP